MTTTSSKKIPGEFRVTFWGTRGTLATPDAQCAKAGGNTVCIEVECGEQTIICDAGTGLRLLGTKLISKYKSENLHLLLSHAHYDHIEGIPFFAPLFSKDYEIDIWCGKLDGAKDTRETVEGFMQRPYFPVGPEVFCAKINYHLLGECEEFKVNNDIQIKTLPLQHPGGATAYRIEFAGKSISYVTDTEHRPGETNQAIVDFIHGTDMFVYDGSLTDEELPGFEGYGHSTWQEGLRMAKQAGAKRYFAYHHMPFRDDDELDEIDKNIKAEMAKSGVARENFRIVL